MMPFNQRPLHGGNLVWAAKLADCSPDAILDFSASINPLGPPESAIAAIQQSLKSLVAYPDPSYHQLRTALGQYHDIPPDWILPGNGAAELLTWACRDLAAGTTYLVTPAFSDYQRALKAFNGEIVDIQWPIQSSSPVAELEFLVSTLQSNPSSKATGLLLNNPHNPTGFLLSKNLIESWLDSFRFVVVDEAFMDFLPPDQQQSLIDRVQDYSNLVIVRSLTKFYSLPGLRLGYAIAHPSVLERWQHWRDPWSVNSLAAAVGQTVIFDTPFQISTWDWLAQTRPQLWEGLAQLSGLDPLAGSANFLLVQSAQSVVQLQHELLKRHQILIRDCLSFAELGDRFFRVAIRTPSENQQLLSGLATIL